MTRILTLHSSPRPLALSVTRRLTAQLIDRLLDEQPHARIVERDLAAKPPGHVGTPLFDALRTVATERTVEQALLVALSDTLIDEVRNADLLVIGAPMYNFGIPTPLKAWIDWISVPGITFRYRANGLVEGLLPGRPAIIVTSRGGDYRPGAFNTGNFAEPHLIAALGLLGFERFEVIGADWQSVYPEAQREGLRRAEQAVATLPLPLVHEPSKQRA